MKMTDHAKVRQNQRGMSNLVIDIIEQYGRCEKAAGGAIKIYLGNREYQNIVHEIKQFLQKLDKAKGGTIIVHDQDILTVYK